MLSLPDSCISDHLTLKKHLRGVYAMKIGELIYIGSSKDIRKRISQWKVSLKAQRVPYTILEAYAKYNCAQWYILEIVADESRNLKWVEQHWLNLTRRSDIQNINGNNVVDSKGYSVRRIKRTFIPGLSWME